MEGIILVIALVGGVYLFGRHTSINDGEEKVLIKTSKDRELIIKIITSFVPTVIIVFGFVLLFGLLGFGQDQMWIVVAAMIIFTMIFCTYTIVEEIRSVNKND